jgi:hypothetical protein
MKGSPGRRGLLSNVKERTTSERIPHLVLRKGHLWSRRKLNVPISLTGRFGDETVYLRLDKEAATSLPASPVRE